MDIKQTLNAVGGAYTQQSQATIMKALGHQECIAVRTYTEEEIAKTVLEIPAWVTAFVESHPQLIPGGASVPSAARSDSPRPEPEFEVEDLTSYPSIQDFRKPYPSTPTLAPESGTPKKKRGRKPKHTGPREYPCDQCGKSFTRTNDLNAHIKSVHEGVRWECPEEGCDSKFSSKTAYTRHMKKHGEAAHECTVEGCEYRTPNVHQLEAHIVKHEAEVQGAEVPKPYTCPVCLSKFSTIAYYRKHEANVKCQKWSKYTCPICSALNKSNRALANHVRKEHPSVDPVPICQEAAGTKPKEVFSQEDENVHSQPSDVVEGRAAVPSPPPSPGPPAPPRSPPTPPPQESPEAEWRAQPLPPDAAVFDLGATPTQGVFSLGASSLSTSEEAVSYSGEPEAKSRYEAVEKAKALAEKIRRERAEEAAQEEAEDEAYIPPPSQKIKKRKRSKSQPAQVTLFDPPDVPTPIDPRAAKKHAELGRKAYEAAGGKAQTQPVKPQTPKKRKSVSEEKAHRLKVTARWRQFRKEEREKERKEKELKEATTTTTTTTASTTTTTTTASPSTSAATSSTSSVHTSKSSMPKRKKKRRVFIDSGSEGEGKDEREEKKSEERPEQKKKKKESTHTATATPPQPQPPVTPTPAPQQTALPKKVVVKEVPIKRWEGQELVDVEDPRSHTCPFCHEVFLTETAALGHIKEKHAN